MRSTPLPHTRPRLQGEGRQWYLLGMFPPPHTLSGPGPRGRAEPLTRTRSAIGQLEARGAETLVGARRVLALASLAVALEVFTLIHVCGATREEGSPWQHLSRPDANGGGFQRACHLPEEPGPMEASPNDGHSFHFCPSPAGSAVSGWASPAAQTVLTLGTLGLSQQPSLGWPHPKALMAQILLRSSRNTHEN